MSMSSTDPAHIFVHIGTMKTGTSYLQQVLERNTDTLARDGAIYANGGPGTHRAIQDALSLEEGATDGAWSRMAKVSREHPGSRVIISNELLSFADDERAQRIVASFAPNPVTVIITARDLVRLLPSAWQNKVKHGRGWPFDRYVDSVIGDGGPKGAARSFWHHHDLGTIVRRWVAAAGADQVVVIPVPGRDAGPDALWERFASVTGLSSSGYDLRQDRRSNLSLGYAETELLRHVNRRLHDQADWHRQKKVIQRLLANEVLRPDPSRPASNERPILTPAQHAWAAAKSRDLAEEVAATGVRVHGELDELVPPPLTEAEERAALTAAPPDTPEMFVDVVAALVVRLVETARGDEPAEDSPDDDQAEWDEHDDHPEPAQRTNRRGRGSGGQRRAGRAGRVAASPSLDERIDPDLAEELDDFEL